MSTSDDLIAGHPIRIDDPAIAVDPSWRRPRGKSSVRDLAICGGPPAFFVPLHVGRPNVPDKASILRRIEQALDDRWLTNGGPLVEQFERKLADTLQVRHCLAICNATTALQIVFRALDLHGEVIVPAWTFPATVHALRWIELVPVFADISTKNYTLDPESVRSVISDQTSAILGVHIWGHACDMERLASLSKRHRLNLIFDACHAFGCTYRRRKIGNFGDAEVFSFHATKSVNSAEGGAIATNDDDLADRIRMMRSFGFSGTDQVRELGINGKMSELSAAVGLTSLEHMDLIHTWNRSNFRHYRAQLDGIPGVSLFESPEGESFNFHYVVVRVEEASSGLHRDDLYEVLRCEGILARRYFAPGCHQIRPYSRQPPRTPLPVTEAAAESVLSLPTGLSVGPEEVRNVCQIIRIAVANADVIRSQRFRHGCPSAVGADQLSARESESI